MKPQSAHWARFRRWWSDWWIPIALVEFGRVTTRLVDFGVDRGMMTLFSAATFWPLTFYVAAVVTTLWIRAATATVRTFGERAPDGGSENG